MLEKMLPETFFSFIWNIKINVHSINNPAHCVTSFTEVNTHKRTQEFHPLEQHGIFQNN